MAYILMPSVVVYKVENGQKNIYDYITIHTLHMIRPSARIVCPQLHMEAERDFTVVNKIILQR